MENTADVSNTVPLSQGPGAAAVPDAASVTQRHRDQAMAALSARRKRMRVLQLLLLVFAVAALAMWGLQVRRTADLERQLEFAQTRVGALEASFQALHQQAGTREEIEFLRQTVDQRLQGVQARAHAMESGSVAPVVAQVVGSIALIQGRFALMDPRTSRFVRFSISKGEPQLLPDGRPRLTLKGRGPVYAPLFTGTAFVVDDAGTLLTNRHVAKPWEQSVAASVLQDLGVRPLVLEMRGFLPGKEESFSVKVLGVSPEQDLALLRGDGAARTVAPLQLASEHPAVGDAALVLGYPTGLNALLARADDAFLHRLGREPGMNEQRAADALAKAGLIRPLVSRGIVAQVSPTAVVYDAQTTSGGSGGPVVNLRGEVLAVTRAVLAGFGGSNLGVPAVLAHEMLESAYQQRVIVKSAPPPAERDGAPR